MSWFSSWGVGVALESEEAGGVWVVMVKNFCGQVVCLLVGLCSKTRTVKTNKAAWLEVSNA